MLNVKLDFNVYQLPLSVYVGHWTLELEVLGKPSEIRRFGNRQTKELAAAGLWEYFLETFQPLLSVTCRS